LPGRPTKCYRGLQEPFTRTEYISKFPGIPDGLKTMTFGNTSKMDFPARVSLVALKEGQVSARAIDSVRATLHRELRVLGEENYRFSLVAYPHHAVRMHGLVGVAKAERLQKGMKLSFGAPQYRMARVKKGHTLLEVAIKDDPIAYHVCKRGLELVKKKLPFSWEIQSQGISLQNIVARPLLPRRVKEKKGLAKVALPTKTAEEQSLKNK